MQNKLRFCPFCGGEFEIGICDDEGNRRDFDYTLDPWSGIGYQLIHTVKHVPEGKFCPIATHKEETIGALIYDSVEEVMEYCNNRADGWIPVAERLPEAEKRVLVCAEVHVGEKVYKHVTAGMYEDGTVWREDSSWNFNDFDNMDSYDEEKDDWRIPEGWWEYTIYNDEDGNYLIDDFVTHWMPLPEPPKGESV